MTFELKLVSDMVSFPWVRLAFRFGTGVAGGWLVVWGLLLGVHCL